MEQKRHWGLWVVVVLGMLGVVSGSAAMDFRLENKVYLGKQREPATETTTIFYNGAVYDFLKKPAEIIIFDKEHMHFILLDTERRRKMELTVQEVEAFVERLRQRASEYSHPFVLFLARPEFEKSFDPTARELKLSSPWMTYRVVTMDAESPELAAQYREFADGLARLNALLNPKRIPPFARLVVNAELYHREELPKEVRLIIHPDTGQLPRKRIMVRSEHQLVRQIVEADRARVQQAIEFQNLFPRVSFEEYQRDHSEK